MANPRDYKVSQQDAADWKKQWLEKLDDYEVEHNGTVEAPIASQARVEALLIPTEVQALHEGTDHPSSDRKRQLLIDHFVTVLTGTPGITPQQEQKRNQNPDHGTITLEDLLGKEGLKLYKAAIEEERNSKSFRNAVFLQATSHVKGQKWKEKLVLWVGGPSAAGKTTAAKAIIDRVDKELIAKDEKDKGVDSGNYVTAIDGAIDRETSQMRQLVLQIALQKGYSGITDLDEVKPSVKEYVFKAASASTTLNLVIPDTFNSSLAEAQFTDFASRDNLKQIFSKVTGGKTRAEKNRFQATVKRLGESRAWSNNFSLENTSQRQIRMNNRAIGCESKKYSAGIGNKNFLGGKAYSAKARNKNYYPQQAQNNKDSIYLEVTNDLVYVKKNDKNEWEPCKAEDKAPLTLTTERAFAEWQNNYKNKNNGPLDFDEWYAIINNQATKSLYASQSDLSVNKQTRINATQPNLIEENFNLDAFLIKNIIAGHDTKKKAIESLVGLLPNLKPKEKIAFYTALRHHVPPAQYAVVDATIAAYTSNDPQQIAAIQLGINDLNATFVDANITAKEWHKLIQLIPANLNPILNKLSEGDKTKSTAIKSLFNSLKYLTDAARAAVYINIDNKLKNLIPIAHHMHFASIINAYLHSDKDQISQLQPQMAAIHTALQEANISSIQWQEVMDSTQADPSNIFKKPMVQPTPKANPLDSLGSILISDITKGGDFKVNAIQSIFDLVKELDPPGKHAFYKSLRAHGIPANFARYDAVIQAYNELAIAKMALQEAEQRQAMLLNKATKHLPDSLKPLSNIVLAARTREAAAGAKIKTDAFKADVAAINAEIKQQNINDAQWKTVIESIPVDPINRNNIFAQPIVTINTNTPTHRDLAEQLPKDFNRYRYVGPKGEGGAQESGPLGGWYITPYKTLPDGKIHFQRVMIKRESNYAKNIIESLAGKLKAAIANQTRDFSANTFLIHDPKCRKTGENVYAVSIAFNDFNELHVLANGDGASRVRGLATKAAMGYEAATSVLRTVNEYHEAGAKGFEENSAAAEFTKDLDMHSGNLGLNTKKSLKVLTDAEKEKLLFLGIDHAGSLLNINANVRPGRRGWLHVIWRVLRGEPTNHKSEYSDEVRICQKMADVYRRNTNSVSSTEIETIIKNELHVASELYAHDPNTLSTLAKRIGVSEAVYSQFQVDKDLALSPKQLQERTTACCSAIKNHLTEVMFARLLSMRRYGKEIQISLFFDYDEAQKKFIVKPENKAKLVQFIRENPNYSLLDQHHFRGSSGKKRRTSFAYHLFGHNLTGYGNEIEAVLRQQTKEVLGSNEPAGIEQFLLPDAQIKDKRTSASRYLARLRLIQVILGCNKKGNENQYEFHAHKQKIDELIIYLEKYRSGAHAKGSRDVQLHELCDSAHKTIIEVFNSLPLDIEKLKIFEIFELMKNSSLLSQFMTPPIDRKRMEATVEQTLTQHNFSVENASLTRALSTQAQELSQVVGDIQHNTDPSSTDIISSASKTLEQTIKSLKSLAGKSATMGATLQKLEQSQDRLKQGQIVSADPKQKQYRAPTIAVNKGINKTLVDSVQDYFSANRSSSDPVTNAGTVLRQDLASAVVTTGVTASDDKAVILGNPWLNPLQDPNKAITSGAAIITSATSKQLIDFSDPTLSAANIIADALFSAGGFANNPVDRDQLRNYIQKFYIDRIQATFAPELINKDNLYKLLIRPLTEHPTFRLQIPKESGMGSFFHRDPPFVDKVLNAYESATKWNPKLLAWVYICFNAMKDTKLKDSDIAVTGCKGNAEFARLSLIYAISRGADPVKANKTGYVIRVTEQDIKRMKAIFEDTNNPDRKKMLEFTAIDETAKQSLQKTVNAVSQPTTIDDSTKEAYLNRLELGLRQLDLSPLSIDQLNSVLHQLVNRERVKLVDTFGLGSTDKLVERLDGKIQEVNQAILAKQAQPRN